MAKLWLYFNLQFLEYKLNINTAVIPAKATKSILISLTFSSTFGCKITPYNINIIPFRQEHEKKKKLDELKNSQFKNPLDQKKDCMVKNQRARRGAVVEA